jgi:hypothetical protein
LTGVDDVVAVRAREHVVPVPAQDEIVIRASVDGVDIIPAADDVVTLLSE